MTDDGFITVSLLLRLAGGCASSLLMLSKHIDTFPFCIGRWIRDDDDDEGYGERDGEREREC